jgi:hypothetical protein
MLCTLSKAYNMTMKVEVLLKQKLIIMKNFILSRDQAIR